MYRTILHIFGRSSFSFGCCFTFYLRFCYVSILWSTMIKCGIVICHIYTHTQYDDDGCWFCFIIFLLLPLHQLLLLLLLLLLLSMWMRIFFFVPCLWLFSCFAAMLLSIRSEKTFAFLCFLIFRCYPFCVFVVMIPLYLLSFVRLTRSFAHLFVLSCSSQTLVISSLWFEWEIHYIFVYHLSNDVCDTVSKYNVLRFLCNNNNTNPNSYISFLKKKKWAGNIFLYGYRLYEQDIARCCVPMKMNQFFCLCLSLSFWRLLFGLPFVVKQESTLLTQTKWWTKNDDSNTPTHTKLFAILAVLCVCVFSACSKEIE